jgi:hypothetical protein
MVEPPSWRMPTSNDTRVRVEGLSKIIASTFPASGCSMTPAFRRVFRSIASSSMPRNASALTVERSVK